MNSYTLSCNIEKCRTPLTEIAWVTRCLHVFCPGHGQAYFSSSSSQINCPICDEINLKDVDILQSEVNPSDMILAGIPPLKAINLAAKSLKLWWFQIQWEERLKQAKLEYAEKKNNEMKHTYNTILNKMKHKYEEEINNLRTYCKAQHKKIEALTSELRSTQNKLQKFEQLVSAHTHRSHVGNLDLSPHGYGNAENFIHSPTPSPPLNATGFNFTFKDNPLFD